MPSDQALTRQMKAFEQQFSEALVQAQIFAAVASMLMYAFICWSAYAVLRAAIREGMLQYDERRRKSPQLQQTASPPGAAPAGFKWVLVPEEALPNAAKPMDMRAD